MSLRYPDSATRATVTAYREQVVAIGIAVAAIANAVFALLRFLAANAAADDTPWHANAIAFLVLAGVWSWFLRDPRARTAYAVNATAAIATVSLLVPLAYGYDSSASWLVLVAVGMLMMTGRVVAWSWMVAEVLLFIAAVIWMNLAGAKLPAEPAAETIASQIGFVIVLVAMTVTFRHAVRTQSRALRVAGAELERSLAVKDRFLGRMGHELRTPLQGILGLTDQALVGLRDDEQRRRIEGAHASARILLRRVNDLLEYASGRETMVLDSRPFALRKLVAEVVEACRPDADRAGLLVDWRVAPGVIDARTGDDDRLRQVLLELLSNAVRFTPSGSVHVMVALERLDQDRLCIDVIDTGIGISSSGRTEYFDAFVQGDDTSTRSHGGLGLGLAMVRRIAGAMDGRISASSGGNGGTRMRLVLGIPAVADGGTAEAAPQRTARSLRLLVCDDDAVCLGLLSEYLGALGHVVHAVADGEAAWSALQVAEFDAVITDMEMPRMDGRMLARRVRVHARSRDRALPVIAVSAGVAGRRRTDDAMWTVFDDFLVKPFTSDDVGVILERLFPADDVHWGSRT